MGEDDIERLADVLGQRGLLGGRPTSGFHYFDFFMGIAFAGSFVGFLYWRYSFATFRSLNRSQKAEAIQALKDMDTETLRRLLGNVNLPSWVNFPDFERVNWVNMVFTQLWPYLSAYISAQAHPQLDPLLQQNKPAWMDDIKLVRFDLGERAPQISGVKVYRADNSSTVDEVIMECDFMWAGQQNVDIVVKPVPRIVSTWLIGVGKVLSTLIRLKVGLNKLIINGRMRVTLTPLMNEMPIVGSMQVSLVDMPDFSFDLDVLGGDVTLLPGLEAWLNSFMASSVLRPYVLPDKYIIQLTDNDLGIETPKGILFVKLLEAENVPRMDLLSKSDPYVKPYVLPDRWVYEIVPDGGVEKPKALLYVQLIEAKNVPRIDWLSKTDPYVKLGVRSSRMATSQVIDNDLNPKWNEEFKLLVHEPEHQELRLVLYDYDAMDRDDEIGEAKVAVKDLKDQQEADLWLDIHECTPEANAQNHKGLGGKVRLIKDATTSVVDKTRRRLGKRKDKACKIHIKVTYYEFKKEEVDAAVEGQRSGRRLTSVPSRVENKEAFNMLMGGVLYVRPRKGHDMVHKPWYKGGRFFKSTAQLTVKVADQVKKSARVQGHDPVFSDTIEFILGGDEIEEPDRKSISVEVWDTKLVKTFRGSCQIPLKDVLDSGRVKDTYRLKHVNHGELELDVQWFSILDKQPSH